MPKVGERLERSRKDKAAEAGGAPLDASLGDVCEKAPEWAEHYRLFDPDDPCDDGRQG